MSANDTKNQPRSVVDLIFLLWREKVTVVAAVALTSFIGVAYALLATPVYKAEVVMTPAGQRSQAGNLGQLGSLAALAGVNIGSGPTTTPLAVMKSREFAEEFIRENKLEKVLVEDFTDPAKKRDIRDALKIFLLDVRVVSEDKKAGTVSLAIFWEDPVVAAEWANAYVARLNAALRDQALAEAERNVKFLQQEISNTDVVSMQQSVGRILEAEMQKYMLAKGAEEFAYKIVDRATPPKLRESPRRTLIVILAAVLGGILATLFIILKHGFVQLPRPTR